MRITDFRNSNIADHDLVDSLLPRVKLDAGEALKQVLPLIEDVRENGVAALKEHALKFDGVSGHSFRVSKAEIDAAYARTDPALISALNEMVSRVKSATLAQLPTEKVTTISTGATILQRYLPVDRVGLYVPGGKAVYPSSVIMNAVTAQVAGVRSIAIASPVQRANASVHDTILAACSVLGIEEVYAIGGASAIAAFAYGVPEIGLDPVQVVTGPGNIFVAAAKRALQGKIAIDAEAGTTEILVLADSSAKANLVAADLLSQAEHDEAAAAVLVTDSEELAWKVQKELLRLSEKTPNRQRAEKALAGEQSAILLVSTIADAVAISNAYAPEHLEIMTRNAHELIPLLTNAGAIFVGDDSPVSLGDYMAGSNHVLPTGGSAKFSSGLNALSFLRSQQVVEYSKEALADTLGSLVTLAEAEGLPAHASAAKERF